MPSELLDDNSLDRSICNRKGVWLFLLLHVPCFKEIPALNAGSVDPNQTPRPLASDIGKHC